MDFYLLTLTVRIFNQIIIFQGGFYLLTLTVRILNKIIIFQEGFYLFIHPNSTHLK